jgi:type IV pilus assembly protein PilA
MSERWYYVDRRQRQQGPVSAAQVRAALRRGDLAADSLLWREGLAQWLPLEQLVDELGSDPESGPGGSAAAGGPPVLPDASAGPLDASEEAPPARQESVAGPAAPPAAPATGLSRGCLIAIIAAVLLPFAVVALAIIAAIAIPAYADYASRAQVLGILEQATPAKAAVESFYAEVGRCPRDAAEIALSQPVAPGLRELRLEEDAGGRCLIELALGQLKAAGGTEAGNLTLTRLGTGDWNCSSNLPPRLLPESCR